MTDFSIQKTTAGCELDCGELHVAALAPHLDRGSVRAALTVTRNGVILFTGTVNLTSSLSRQRFLREAKEAEAALQENALLALEAVCRTWRAYEQTIHDVRPSNISGKVIPTSWDDLECAFHKWLLIEGKALLRVLFGTILAHHMSGDPTWLFLIAPPGGVKTEVLRATYGLSTTFPLSDLTARTFASGLDSDRGDPSLLARLKNQMLVLKDFTTVLEMSVQERQAILSQLREIYDGRFDKSWGTGKELHWTGRLGFLAGVTPIIDRHQAALAVLGERFIQLRIQQPERRQVAKQAMATMGLEDAMRSELADIVVRWWAGVPDLSTPPTVSAEHVTKLAAIADLVTRGRSGVLRDGYRRELDYAPEPEAPTRFARQLYGLLRGLTALRGASTAGPEDMALVQRVALDCLPAQRRLVLSALVQGEADAELSTSNVAGRGQYSTQTVRRALEDLQALGIVEVRKHGQGNADTWLLPEEWRDTFSEMSGGYTPHKAYVEVQL